jgi:hypothetical protein
VRVLCPACRKLNEPVVLASATCSRCGCGLSTLWAIRAAATRSQQAAARALHRRDWAAALENAGHSWSLLNSLEAARLAALACGALGQIEELLTWRHRVATVKHE